MKKVVTKKNLENCTHPVPPNDYGIFAMHSFDNQPLPPEDLKRFIEGPITAVQKELDEELAKVDDLRQNKPE